MLVAQRCRAGLSARGGLRSIVRSNALVSRQPVVMRSPAPPRLSQSARFSAGNGANSERLSLLVRYSNFLAKYPLLGNVLSSGVIGGVGDIVCQIGIEGTPLSEFDWKRCARLIGVNCVLVGPTLTVWYGFLGRATAGFGTGLVATMKRTAIDQLLFAPPFIALFFMTAATFEGKMMDGPERVRKGWADAVLANYSLWPAAQMINFGLVPAAFRVLFSNCVGVVWNSYLSYATARLRSAKQAQEASPASTD